jgi:hypothetical protein
MLATKSTKDRNPLRHDFGPCGPVQGEKRFFINHHPMNLFSKYGGYRKLDSYTVASVIQLGTWRFCTTL